MFMKGTEGSCRTNILGRNTCWSDNLVKLIIEHNSNVSLHTEHYPLGVKTKKSIRMHTVAKILLF